MTHDALEESVPLYAAGALDRIERQALEAHLLSGCASCHSALKDYQSVAALLPLALTPGKVGEDCRYATRARRPSQDPGRIAQRITAANKRGRGSQGTAGPA